MPDTRYLRVAVIRRTRPKAVQVILGEYPHQCVWLPRSGIVDGASLRAGERDLLLCVAEWVVRVKKLPYDE
jgi:hypothetical protein